MTPFLWYIIAISAVAAVLTVYDKCVAKRRGRRIPEKTLFAMAILGGSAAMLLTMYLIRHKTKHKRFMLGLPLIIVIQIAIWYTVVYVI